ncbi:MAG: hypothetical protein EPO19_11545 [Betaproteobacteria bacterium]|nr:MAG: hypothetical protein EPO19_11545 [Betaproteobacteria bacterium]
MSSLLLSVLLGYAKVEVANRATLTVAIEIGRRAGMVTVTLPAPMERPQKAGLADVVREQYGV